MRAMKATGVILFGCLCMASALTIPPEKRAVKSEAPEGGKPRGLSLAADHNSVGKSSSRFFGGIMPPFVNPNSGFFPSPIGGYNMGTFPNNPYISPFGYMSGPMNYGGFYPSINPGFYGNNFGEYSTTHQQQQQQQQQTSQIGTGGSAIGGFQPSFG